MNNKFISPLYLYIKSQIKFLGIKNIGRHNIQKAYDAICLLIDNCCIIDFPKTKNAFLNNVYSILKTVTLPTNLRKLKEVKNLLEPYTNNSCC